MKERTLENLKQRVEVAWFKKTGQSGGYDEWLAVRPHMSQDRVGKHFDVHARTVATWEEDYKRLNKAQV